MPNLHEFDLKLAEEQKIKCCVKDQSETVIILRAWRGREKGEMAHFLNSGCQKYGRPLGPHDMWKQINISWNGDGPELLGSQWLDLWK